MFIFASTHLGQENYLFTNIDKILILSKTRTTIKRNTEMDIEMRSVRQYFLLRDSSSVDSYWNDSSHDSYHYVQISHSGHFTVLHST